MGFCAVIPAAVTAGATTIAFNSQGVLTALAAGAAYPYVVAGTRAVGATVEYMIATADNGSGTLTVVRGQYATAAQAYVAGDALIRETPRVGNGPAAAVAGQSATPTGNVSTTEKAMGLGGTAGFTITPQSTGRVAVIIAGVALNATLAGDGTNVTGRYGTGTAPVNGATAGLGTAFGATQHVVASTVAGQQGFTVLGTITGLVVGVPVWFDISLLAVTAGGATVKDVQILAWEY